MVAVSILPESLLEIVNFRMKAVGVTDRLEHAVQALLRLLSSVLDGILTSYEGKGRRVSVFDVLCPSELLGLLRTKTFRNR
jgi:hypothetical protein